MADQHYRVTVTLHDEDDPVRASLALTEAFGESERPLPIPRRLTADPGSGDVEVDFEVARGASHALRLQRADGTPATLAALPLEPGAIMPAIKALIAVSAARSRVRLAPHQRLTVDVEPQPAAALAIAGRWDEAQEL